MCSPHAAGWSPYNNNSQSKRERKKKIKANPKHMRRRSRRYHKISVSRTAIKTMHTIIECARNARDAKSIQFG